MTHHSKIHHPERDASPRPAPRGVWALLLSLLAAAALVLIAQVVLTPAVLAQPSPAAEGAADEAVDRSASPAPVEGSGEEVANEAPDGPVPDSPVAERAGGGPTVVYGRVDDEINLSTSAFIKRLVDEAKAVDADLLILDLNTFGGRIDAAIAIRDALIDAPMRTVTYINKRAISAGALISYATDTIAISPGGTIGAAMPVSGNPGQEIPEAVQEKYLSYFREEMRVTAESGGRDPDIAEAMVDRDKVIDDVTTEGKLLTLGTRDAVRLGVADFEAESLEALLERLGVQEIDIARVERSWSEGLAAFLTSQAIASMLLLGMMLFGYLELQTPGFGFFGAIAAFCFLLLYFSHYLTNLAGHEELLLFALGLILLGVEVLLLPGVGVFAIAGTLSILASVVLVLSAGDWSDLSFSNPITFDAMQQVAVVTVASFIGLILLVRRIAPAGAHGSQGGLLLQETLSTAAGYSSFESEEDAWIGRRGQALTQLRPSGKARFDGKRLNVETEGDWIDRGDDVVITRRSEGRLVVRRA